MRLKRSYLTILTNSTISLIHTFVNIPALLLKNTLRFLIRAGILTKVGKKGYDSHVKKNNLFFEIFIENILKHHFNWFRKIKIYLGFCRKRKFIEDFSLEGYISQHEITPEELVYYAGKLEINDLNSEKLVTEILNGRKMEKIFTATSTVRFAKEQLQILHHTLAADLNKITFYCHFVKINIFSLLCHFLLIIEPKRPVLMFEKLGVSIILIQ